MAKWKVDWAQRKIVPTSATFDGATIEPARDHDRLRAQLHRVLNAVSDHEWRTLHQISAITGDPEASVSARLRDLRKDKFGGYTIERQYAGEGLWEYRLP